MITHIVLFKLKARTDEQTIAQHMAEFRALAQSVTAISAIDVERDFVGRDVSAEFGLVVQVPDRDALDDYRLHPDHQAAFARLKPNLDHMLVLDYER